MKKLLLSIFAFAYLSLSANACQFHQGDNSSRYAWSGIDFNHSPLSYEDRFAAEKEIDKPDFRYASPRPALNSGDKTKPDIDKDQS